MTAPAIPDAANGPAIARAVTLREAWRLAGILFLAGALSTIPLTLLLENSEPWMYALTGVGALTGVACLVAPWWRLPEWLLAALPVIAVIETVAAVAASDFVFTYLYFIIALWVSLVYPEPRRMAPFLALILIALAAPLAYEDEPVREGLLWAFAAGPAIVLTALVVGRLTSGLEASREAYRQLSTEDGLTGVANYRSLIERLRHETARHRRRGREFAVLTLDLDNFKQVNETQGHLVGDLLLAIVGAMLAIKVRTEDAVFRQGGDEFSVIAPETGYDEVEGLAVRISEALASISSAEVELSTSVGYAIFPHDGSEPGELLDAADTALLGHKRRLAPPVGSS